MLDGFWSERATWAHRIDASGSSSSDDDEAYLLSNDGFEPSRPGLWPTVVVQDAKNAARHTTTTGVMHPGTMLLDAVRLNPGDGPKREQWATPTAEIFQTTPEDFERRRQAMLEKGYNRNGAGVVLAVQVQQVERRKNVSGLEAVKRSGQFPTPRASPSEQRTYSMTPTHGETHGAQLQAVVCDLEGESVAPGTMRVNADWCESLMGFPAGWTDVEIPSKTDGPPRPLTRNTSGKRRGSSSTDPPTGLEE